MCLPLPGPCCSRASSSITKYQQYLDETRTDTHTHTHTHTSRASLFSQLAKLSLGPGSYWAALEAGMEPQEHPCSLHGDCSCTKE